MTPAHAQQKTKAVVSDRLHLAHQHYENFPVASFVLPAHLRESIALIYRFARQADDFADEGELSIAQRLSLLNEFRQELDLLAAYIKPKTDFFQSLGTVIKTHRLPYQAFYDLLDAFTQDVSKTRYANYAEIAYYCERSANPVGRILLALYGQATAENTAYADHVCTALQLTNFLQDITIDLQKNAGKQRIYLCQDEMLAYGISEQTLGDLAAGVKSIDANWQAFMHFNLSRAEHLLAAGKPLGRQLSGRIGFEMRMIIAGAERILAKIKYHRGDVFKHRPRLHALDWLRIVFSALVRR
ncbi:MAG: squalene synthase HpnC [Methylotenera sp.]|nr:squalene synthase HpnC [Methylotenera sp.]